MAEQVGSIYYEVTADTSKLVGQSRVVDRETSRMAGSFTKMAAAISAALSAIAIEGFVSKLVTTQRQFDVMFASLKTMTGGADQAGAAFERLRKFAAQTPFTLEQSVNGFVKLKALGIEPTERAMTSFGNTSAAMGKDLTQMIEAVADASTGEFERLKEFGIKAKQEGDRVSLTFQGVTTNIGNNSAEIVEYLTKIGEVEFAGAMSERMKTLDGDISNLQDSLSALYLSISQSGAGDAIAAGVRKASEAIQELTTSIREGGLTEYFAPLRPVIAAAELAVVALAGSIAGRMVAAFIAMATKAYTAAAAVGAATVATRAFSTVLASLGGFVGIAITALALLALNWEKVGGQARDAATISEEAAERIAGALKKAPTRAAADLQAQLAETNEELALIQRELGRTGANMAAPEDLAELQRRRDVLLKVAADIRAAMNNVYGSGRRPANEGGGRLGANLGVEPTKPRLKRNNTEEFGYAILNPQEDYKQNFLRLDKNYEATDRYLDELNERGQEADARRLADRARAEAAARANLTGIAIDGDPVAIARQQEADKLEQLKTDLAAEYITLEEFNTAKVTLEQQTAEKLKQIRDKDAQDQAAAQSAMLANYGNLFGGLAELTRTFEGEQSSTYKAMFAVSKAFAIADSIIKIQQGVANALSLPYPANIAAAASTAASAAGLISTIKGTNYGGGRQYGGPVSAGSMYRVNETGRPEMYTASNGAQYMLPTANGSVTPADQVGGGVQWTINVTNAPPGTTATVDSDNRVIDIAVARSEANFVRQMSDNSGPMFRALAGSTNVRGAL